MRKFKSLICAVLAAISVVCAVSCGGGTNTTYSPALPAQPKDDYRQYLNEQWSSVNDMSDMQGYRNWYYYCGDPYDKSLELMVFNDYYGRWSSKYQQLYFDTYMWSNVWLPEDQQGYGIGMGFKAPASGRLQIVAEVTLLAEEKYNSGDGVVFSISDKNGLPHDAMSIDAYQGGQKQTMNLTIDIKMDEEVLFMLFPNTNNKNDFTEVNVTIKYAK